MQSRGTESGFIFTLARTAEENISRGYYRDLDASAAEGLGRRSLRDSIRGSKLTPVLAEIKFTSPAEGKLRKPGDVGKIAKAYERGGVSGISVLTEPRHFEGDIRYLPLVKRSVRVPVLMKDIIIDPEQIDAGARMGADAILFIAAIFMNRLSHASLDEMFKRARENGLEVLFEAHTMNEFNFALESEADVVGINNRDLDTLEVSLATSKAILAASRERREALKVSGRDKPIVSESGITSRRDILELREMGADAFLVGSALMKSSDLQSKVASLTGKGADR